MDLLHEDDITPSSVRRLRRSLDLSQPQFWVPLGVTREAGANYESGRLLGGIPNPVRRLVFLHYVAKIPTDAHPGHLRYLGRVSEVREQMADKAGEAAMAVASLSDRLEHLWINLIIKDPAQEK